MTIKCNNINLLLTTVCAKYPEAEVSHPTATQTKIDLPEGLVMNIFTTGTVNFQGKSFENHIATDIVNLIEFINRPAPSQDKGQ